MKKSCAAIKKLASSTLTIFIAEYPYDFLAQGVGSCKKNPLSVDVIGQTRAIEFEVRGFIDDPGKSNDWYAKKHKGKTAYLPARYVEEVYR
ncbi:MAG: hypothetical protein LBJ91_01670 [Clostridiales Family XIII bacterium]|nr:hypothetical protein [Clostridiales Family XIII bacterium]